ncbi:hypothetical protein GEMRC1_003138 [Eukaryota sp. GEM-RC1]
MTEICSSSQYGQHLVTPTAIQASSSLLFESPLVFVPTFPLLNNRCDVCGVIVSNPSICHRCHMFSVCKTCQRTSWHDAECDVFSNFKYLPDNDGFSSLMLVRLALRCHLLPSESKDFLNQLCHVRDLSSAKLDSYQNCSALLNALGLEFNDSTLFSRLETNCHDVPTHPDVPSSSGMALYPMGRLLNHSCTPNCSMTCLSGKLELTSIKPIKKREMLTVSYINNFCCVHERREELGERYGFSCDCQGCQTPSLLPDCSLLCPSCQSTRFSLHEDNSCKSCSLNNDQVSSLISDDVNCLLKDFKNGSDKFDIGDYGSLISFLKILKGAALSLVLHPPYYFRLTLLLYLVYQKYLKEPLKLN